MKFFIYSAAISIVCAALISAATIGSFAKSAAAQSRSNPEEQRYDSIDGLRGLLAIGVYIHHCAFWYWYNKTGDWTPKNVPTLLTQLGPGSVALFFMVTAFLFTSKFIKAGSEVDWLRLYVSRLFRILPLYYCALGAVILLVILISHDTLHGALSLHMMGNVAQWATFFDYPDLNGVPNTRLMVAGTFWSLTYEWFFYLSLPLIALFMWRKVPPKWAISSVVAVSSFVAIVWRFHVPFYHLEFFVGGFIAAGMASVPKWRAYLRTQSASIFILLYVVATVKLMDLPIHIVSVLLLSVPFSVVACGNSLFGLLTHSAARRLGEISYGIFLFHGLVLYLVFRVFLAHGAASRLALWQYWLLVLLLTPIVVILAQFAHTLIEQPASKRVGSVTEAIRKSFPSL